MNKFDLSGRGLPVTAFRGQLVVNRLQQTDIVENPWGDYIRFPYLTVFGTMLWPNLKAAEANSLLTAAETEGE